MSGLTGAIMDTYIHYVEKKKDPRTADWFLVGSPASLLTILATYVYFCKYAGPRYMKDRKPYELKNVIIIYNIFQIFISCYLVYEALDAAWLRDYSLACQPVDYSNDPQALRMARTVWLYFIVKLIELLDTVFFVLRKKYNQVSYLHLYHHTLMPFCAWVGITYLPGGHGTLMGTINTFIHVIMYGYYLIASLGPQYQKYLWWKKHLTSLQMVQFLIVFVHNFQVLFRDCGYPKVLTLLLATQALYFTYLFGKFYINMYIKNNKVQENDVKTKENGHQIKQTEEKKIN